MVIIEESKAYIKILYLVIGYGLWRLIRLPWQRTKKVQMTLSRSCLNSGRPSASMAVATEHCV